MNTYPKLSLNKLNSNSCCLHLIGRISLTPRYTPPFPLYCQTTLTPHFHTLLHNIPLSTAPHLPYSTMHRLKLNEESRFIAIVSYDLSCLEVRAVNHPLSRHLVKRGEIFRPYSPLTVSRQVMLISKTIYLLI